MLIKKTKSGRFSFGLDRTEREKVFGALTGFLEHERVMMMKVALTKETEVMRMLYYSVLNEIMLRKEFHLHNNAERKMIFSLAESVALMWMLRHFDHDSSMLDIKSGIHKQLHS